MMVVWALYCGVVAALLGLAARAGEAALVAVGRPVRWAWAGSLAGSVVVPAGAWLGGADPAVVGEPAGGVPGAGVLPLLELAASAAPPAVDRLLLAAWLASSCVAAGVVVLAQVRLRAARRGWVRGEVEGVPVLVSAGVGPAAFGFFRGAIVVPGWALGLESRLRRLMVVHEREHLRAGDPRLVWLGLVAAIAMPWNPALWWQLRRLRLAIELDCDARVLRREADARTYGALLLEVGRRRCGAGLAAPALSEPSSYLERRIRMIVRPEVAGGVTRAGALLAASIGLAALACETPEPSGVSRGAAVAADVAEVGEYVKLTADMTQPELKNRPEVVGALNRYYPPLLREAGIGGTAQVLLWIDRTGEVTRWKVARSSGRAELDAAAAKVAESMAFMPAARGGEPAAVVVLVPVVFRPDAAEGA